MPDHVRPSQQIARAGSSVFFKVLVVFEKKNLFFENCDFPKKEPKKKPPAASRPDFPKKEPKKKLQQPKSLIESIRN